MLRLRINLALVPAPVTDNQLADAEQWLSSQMGWKQRDRRFLEFARAPETGHVRLAVPGKEEEVSSWFSVSVLKLREMNGCFDKVPNRADRAETGACCAAWDYKAHDLELFERCEDIDDERAARRFDAILRSRMSRKDKYALAMLTTSLLLTQLDCPKSAEFADRVFENTRSDDNG